jgi:hypothetical protein
MFPDLLFMAARDGWVNAKKNTAEYLAISEIVLLDFYRIHWPFFACQQGMHTFDRTKIHTYFLK